MTDEPTEQTTSVEDEQTPSQLDIGQVIGMQQAFGLIGAKCSAGQAELLRQIRDTGVHRFLNLSWDDFCPRYVGVSRQHVDATIRRLNEFGDVYFRLSAIVNVSPETFREMLPRISGGTIEIAGNVVPIEPENAPAIRAEVNRLRDELRSAKTSLARHARIPVDRAQTTLDNALCKLRNIGGRLSDQAERESLRTIIHAAVDQLSSLERSLGES